MRHWIWCFFKGGHDFRKALHCYDCGEYRWYPWSCWKPWSMGARKDRAKVSEEDADKLKES